MSKDCNVYVTFEDQQKINKFARLYAKMESLQSQVKGKQDELKNLEDACDEVSNLFLLDEDVKIPYYIGEVFVWEDMEKTQGYLDDLKVKKKTEISNLESQSADLKNILNDLKTQLKAKFGSSINLDVYED
ncbi:prefoldin subunit 4 [Nomia melanderi]|uniref:prefoldin subunit 4 n=1 Tax=Nomia melanderi TaxID=2448451 RepID=UPI001304602A|nr:prefoldin subunit 4 [Nomia melanderi]XP_031840542.1 prefoldin subunit 4 [Nomia melanderi]